MWVSPSPPATDTTHRPLSPIARRYADYGVKASGLGSVLCLTALFTNSVPDPSFPWFTLPPSLRLPVTQPRIEHWPVTYTVGIWLWVRRWGRAPVLLVIFGVAAFPLGIPALVEARRRFSGDDGESCLRTVAHTG